MYLDNLSATILLKLLFIKLIYLSYLLRDYSYFKDNRYFLGTFTKFYKVRKIQRAA